MGCCVVLWRISNVTVLRLRTAQNAGIHLTRLLSITSHKTVIFIFQMICWSFTETCAIYMISCYRICSLKWNPLIAFISYSEWLRQENNIWRNNSFYMGDFLGQKNGGELYTWDDGYWFHCVQRKYHSAFLSAQASFVYLKHFFITVSIIDYICRLYLTIFKHYTRMCGLTLVIILNVTLWNVKIPSRSDI